MYNPATNYIKAVIGTDVVSVISNQEYVVYPSTNSPYPIYIVETPPLKLYKGINLIGAHPTTGVSASVNPTTGAYTTGTVLWGSAAHSITANSSTYTSGITFAVDSSSGYKPVPFMTTSTTGRSTVNVNYGLMYNPATNYIKATRFEGLATSSLYADLAERYAADAEYEPGTVVVIGGEKEVTISTFAGDTAVAGIVSTNPALMMNSEAGNDKTHPYIALKGRVPCKIYGPVKKGDFMIASGHPGYACSVNLTQLEIHPGAVIGKALEDFHSEGFGVIEVKI
jgi:hypothetical protein